MWWEASPSPWPTERSAAPESCIPPEIDGEPTTFGTSGFLFRSNKLMYDRITNTLWHQLTGEPVVGPLADRDIRLDFFAVELTTWEEWLFRHPDTTVISNDTGLYPPEIYAPEGHPNAIYTDYFASPDTMFPVWQRSDELAPKEVVLGSGGARGLQGIPDSSAEPREGCQRLRLGGLDVVVIASATSEAARVYERARTRIPAAAGRRLRTAADRSRRRFGASVGL